MPKEFSTGLTVYIYIIIFIFGACIGSFINCAADRYVCKQSVLRGRSHCPSCGHALGILDLFPVISYLLLKGKCRYCGSKIPFRCLITELFGGIAYLLVVMRFGFSFVSLQYALLLPALLAVSLIDLDTMEIPNGLICYSTLIFVLFLPTYADYKSRLQDGLIGLLVFGGGTLILSLVMDFLLGKESLGGGDIKLFGVLGLFLGPVLGLLMLLLSCIVGLPFALVARKYSETTQLTFPTAREPSPLRESVNSTKKKPSPPYRRGRWHEVPDEVVLNQPDEGRGDSEQESENSTAREPSPLQESENPTKLEPSPLQGGAKRPNESLPHYGGKVALSESEMTDEGKRSEQYDAMNAVTFPPLTSDELLPSLDSSTGIKSFSSVDFLPSENPIGAFPFGPSICFSAFITFIVGQNLVYLYLSLW